MTARDSFDLYDFLPYLLNQAAEETSIGFGRIYKDRYGMLRTEWRVLVHLGRYGTMTAKEIGERARIHKTKVSRAVRALQDKRMVIREEVAADRRSETLKLSRAGVMAHDELVAIALDYERDLAAQFTAHEQAILRKCLRRLAMIDG